MQTTHKQHAEESYDREEEYLSAQRAAVEAVLVGRQTLEQAEQQREQLDRAEAIADETQYKLEKAARILRGMTWSGWVANMFSHQAGPPPDRSDVLRFSSRQPPTVYEEVPPPCQRAAQAVQNYHANVNVLEACETDEQKETCRIICDDMFERAKGEVGRLAERNDVGAYAIEFASDLDTLRTRQIQSQERRREISQIHANGLKKELLEQTSGGGTPKNSTTRTDAVLQRQDEHLEFMAESLGELGSIAKNLNISVDHQTRTIDSLDSKSDDIIEQSRMVTRRADRIVQKRSWTPVKAIFDKNVSIRHISSGKYLSIVNGDVYLVPKLHPETCVFGLWKRQGQIFGLKSKFSDRWVGQNLFGSLSCTASSFGRREEWEAPGDDPGKTKLLCASAGWGAGGYLLVRPKDFAVFIGGSRVEDRNKADLWSISDFS